MLEQMYPINSKGKGKGKGESEGDAGVDFSAVRERWERFILHNMRSPTANAGLKIFVHSPTGASCCGHSIPFGHLGSDGWSLAYYHPWAAHPALARTMWTGGTKKVRVGSCIASLVWAREGARPVARERERTRTSARERERTRMRAHANESARERERTRTRAHANESARGCRARDPGPSPLAPVTATTH